MNDSIIKIGIVDDHAIVRSGLRQFFNEQVDLRVVGEASTGREAIAAYKALYNKGARRDEKKAIEFEDLEPWLRLFFGLPL